MQRFLKWIDSHPKTSIAIVFLIVFCADPVAELILG